MANGIRYAVEKSSSLRTEVEPLALTAVGCSVTSARAVSMCGDG